MVILDERGADLFRRNAHPIDNLAQGSAQGAIDKPARAFSMNIAACRTVNMAKFGAVNFMNGAGRQVR